MSDINERENDLFDDWEKGRPSFSRDGLADPVAYQASITKIVLLMKEVNDPMQTNFDLRGFIKGGGRGYTWNTVTRWIRGIRTLEVDPSNPLPWPIFSNVDRENRRKYLPGIGVINLKKSAGGGTSNNDELVDAVENDADFIGRQVNLYRPDLYICCGTGWLVDSVPALFTGTWSETVGGVGYRRLDSGATLISYLHPAARVSGKVMFDGLMGAVKELMFPGD